MFDYDTELRRHDVWLRRAADVGAADRVLDIGCGTGRTTREAATSARVGSALGVDLSGRMVERARRLTEEEGIRNVAFEHADAETHTFAPEHFTLGISRFGTMFFTDPLAGFRNIGSALLPGARLVQLVWQAEDRQEWVVAIRQALAGGRTIPTGLGRAAFSLADPTVMTGVLTTAGFTAVEITEVREPVCYGRDASSARDAACGLEIVTELLTGLDMSATAQALDRVLAMLQAHETDDGVWLESRAWLVSARRT